MIHLFLLKYFILTYGVEISISMNDFNDYLDYKENDVFCLQQMELICLYFFGINFLFDENCKISILVCFLK